MDTSISIYSFNGMSVLSRITLILSRKNIQIKHLVMFSLSEVTTFNLTINSNHDQLNHVLKLIEKQVDIFKVSSNKICFQNEI